MVVKSQKFFMEQVDVILYYILCHTYFFNCHYHILRVLPSNKFLNECKSHLGFMHFKKATL